jgi:hypothetical protein
MERLARSMTCLANKNERFLHENDIRGGAAMNRTVTSLLAVGLGIAAYQLAQRNNALNMRTMKKMGRRMMKPFM